MGFVCPHCYTVDTLKILASIQLPPDISQEERTLQVIGCSVCRFRGLAIYREESRGRVGDVAGWQHAGYRASEDEVQAILAAIRSCPDPWNGCCECPSHRKLGRTDNQGHWQGLVSVQLKDYFPMKIADLITE